MPQKFYKHKLLLDEGFFYKQSLPITNSRFNVKHIKGDYKYTSLSDPKVYAFAVKEDRIIVTLNVKDYKPLAPLSKLTGVIGVSANLSLDQIDKKLTALLTKSTKKSLLGKLSTISEEI
ncbi:DUF5615 family PIN-like protein [Candidatus Daviesbacteria bacterium]|nr:DUF5615 family PIN-like protein [Candidatus Daviesbacteria bacterium]